MKKVSFDTSGSIALHIKLGRQLTPDQRKPVKLEGWLVGDHICVQKLQAGDRGWCLSLYPWGDKLTSEFFAKADATDCAREISRLGIPWEHIRARDIHSDEYGDHIEKVLEICERYEVDGLVMPVPIF